jgi:hypothetical protein
MSSSGWNPSDKDSGYTLSNGDRTATRTTGFYDACLRSDVSHSSGKWYAEVKVYDAGTTLWSNVGIATSSANLDDYVGENAYSWSYFQDGDKYTGGSSASYGASYSDGDVIGIAADLDAGTLTFYLNNVSQGTAYTGLSGTFFIAFSNYYTDEYGVANFDGIDLTYQPPSGYSPWSADADWADGGGALAVGSDAKGSAYVTGTWYTSGTGALAVGSDTSYAIHYNKNGAGTLTLGCDSTVAIAVPGATSLTLGCDATEAIAASGTGRLLLNSLTSGSLLFDIPYAPEELVIQGSLPSVFQGGLYGAGEFYGLIPSVFDGHVTSVIPVSIDLANDLPSILEGLAFSGGQLTGKLPTTVDGYATVLVGFLAKMYGELPTHIQGTLKIPAVFGSLDRIIPTVFDGIVTLNNGQSIELSTWLPTTATGNIIVRYETGNVTLHSSIPSVMNGAMSLVFSTRFDSHEVDYEKCPTWRSV